MNPDRVIPVEDVVAFYEDLKSCSLKTEYILSDHFTYVNRLSKEELQEVMSVGVSAESVMNYMDKLFNLDVTLNGDKPVKAFKLTEEAMKVFGSIIVKFVTVKEPVLHRFSSH